MDKNSKVTAAAFQDFPPFFLIFRYNITYLTKPMVLPTYYEVLKKTPLFLREKFRFQSQRHYGVRGLISVRNQSLPNLNSSCTSTMNIHHLSLEFFRCDKFVTHIALNRVITLAGYA